MSEEHSNQRWWLPGDELSDGPFDVEAVRTQIRTRQLTSEHLACAVGSSEWLPLRTWKDVFGDVLKDDSRNDEIPIHASSGKSKSQKTVEEHLATPGTNSATLEPFHDASEDLPQTTEFDLLEVLPKWGLCIIVMAPWLLPDFGGPLETPWLIAFASFFVGMILFASLIKPSKNDIGSELGAFFFTFLTAIPIIFSFQAFSDRYTGVPFSELSMPGGVRSKVFIFFSWLAGNGYSQISVDDGGASLSLFAHIFAMFTSVALCEELLKLVPVIFIARRNTVPWQRKAILVGAMSGLGFGVVEGVLYHFQSYQPMQAPLSIYLLRFFSAAILHGCWTAISAAIYYSASASSKLTSGEAIGCAFMSILVSMLLHTLYNVFCVRNMMLALLMVGVSLYVALQVFQPKPDSLFDEY